MWTPTNRRQQHGRDASPSTAVIDSRSVKATEAGSGADIMPASKSSAASLTPRSTRTAVSSRFRRIRLQFKSDGAGPLTKASRRAFLSVALAFSTAPEVPMRVASATCIATQVVVG